MRRPQAHRAAPNWARGAAFARERYITEAAFCIVRCRTRCAGVQMKGGRSAALPGSNMSTWLQGGERMGSPEEKNKPSTTLPGTVEKIIKPVVPSEPEKAQINIE